MDQKSPFIAYNFQCYVLHVVPRHYMDLQVKNCSNVSYRFYVTVISGAFSFGCHVASTQRSHFYNHEINFSHKLHEKCLCVHYIIFQVTQLFLPWNIPWNMDLCHFFLFIGKSFHFLTIIKIILNGKFSKMYSML